MSQNRNSKVQQGSAMPVAERGFVPAAEQAHTQVSGMSSATGINVPRGVANILVQAITQNIRYTLDGTTPTSSLGFRLTAGNDPLLIPIVQGRTTLKFIEETSGAILQYQFGE